jgi:hypothetical protein
MMSSICEFMIYKGYKGLTPLLLTLKFSLFYYLKNSTENLRWDEQRI